MDEQAGPGVFFNNNSSGLPGGGNVKAPQPGDYGGGEAARAQYNIPGILHFLQHEWARFEVERAQWEVERAELQAQIAFLQGERRGQENLKKDLVRRIKMLEYALKQERAKYHKLKYGTELNQGEIKPPSYDSGETDVSLPPPLTCGRSSLVSTLRYLQEVGYTDTILDVKSQRVRALLGLTGDSGDKPSEKKPEPMVNGTEPSSLKDSGMVSFLIAMNLNNIQTCFHLFVSSRLGVDDSCSSNSSCHISSVLFHLVSVCCHFVSLVLFPFMVSVPSPAEPLLLLLLQTQHIPFFSHFSCFHFANVCFFISFSQNSFHIIPLRSSSDSMFLLPPPPGPNRSKLQDMLANLRDAEDLPSMQPPVTPPSRPAVPRLSEPEVGRPEDGKLPSVSITNNKDALRKTWNPKFTLRSHFDSVRSLAFHPVEPVLVTASEDHTLKLWNLQKTAPAKKCAALDVEPIYTFRAHSGAVLCVTMSSSGEQCFSGGVDGTIQSWNTPNPNVDPYDSYEPVVLRGALCGHTDSVWGLVYGPAHHRLLSCSADGTVRLWNAADTSPSLAVFNERGELGVPTSVDLVSSEPAHMVTSFTTGHIGLFNMETQQLVLKLESAGPPDAPCKINKVLSHPTLPITITAQEDRHIQFFDNNTGKLIHSMVAHLDSVTSLAVDPNGLYLMSGSHDCSIRLWNMESKTCIQEFTAHRKKFEESIHDVAFHPTKCYIGSAGADALAKVFV
uniref:Striatin n=1 Tax=Sparus aurata TaxID=8175 RepID=A0A671VR33_SPAAU